MKTGICCLMVVPLGLACSPGTSVESAGPQSGEAGNASGSAGGSGPGPVGGSGGSAVFIDVDVGGGSGGVPDEQVCDSLAVEPEVIEVEVPVQVPVEVPVEVEVLVEVPYEVITEVPTALYIMLDKSGSMDQGGGFLGLGGGTTKWVAAVDSLTAFVSDPGSAGLRVAIQYFPIAGGTCEGLGYETPAVPMADLPGNRDPIVTSLTTEAPNGSGTPIGGGLNGLTRFCTQYQIDNPGWNCVGVLVTDGQPSDCFQIDLAATARTAFQDAGVRTFAVGMDGADFNLLNTIATEGQGDCDPNAGGFQACNVTASQTAFLEALRLIRQTVSVEVTTEVRTETQIQTEYETHYETRTESSPLPCEFGIPDPPEGETFDKDKVNVSATISDGVTQGIGTVPTQADCASATGGWYYDNADQPTRILLCPDTCTVLESTGNARIDILLGCESEPAILK